MAAIASPITMLREASVIRRWQIALIALGLALLAVGGLVLLDQVSPNRYLGILIWFAGAIIIHDGIIAPLVFALNVLLRRVGRRIPFAVLAILQGAVVVGAIVALIVFPEIVKQRIGTTNPSVLPLDYTTNLLVFYAALAVATAVVVIVYLRMRARRRAPAE